MNFVSISVFMVFLREFAGRFWLVLAWLPGFLGSGACSGGCLCGAAKFLVRKGVSDYLFVSKNIDC